jgi:hypothetical protein
MTINKKSRDLDDAEVALSALLLDADQGRAKLGAVDFLSPALGLLTLYRGCARSKYPNGSCSWPRGLIRAQGPPEREGNRVVARPMAAKSAWM